MTLDTSHFEMSASNAVASRGRRPVEKYVSNKWGRLNGPEWQGNQNGGSGKIDAQPGQRISDDRNETARSKIRKRKAENSGKNEETLRRKDRQKPRRR